MSNTNDFQRNANYTGDNLETSKWQARADACVAEIGRLRREARCTLTVFERILHTEMVATAIYFDELVKLNGTWKMKKRLQVLDPGMTQTEYGRSLINKYVASLSK